MPTVLDTLALELGLDARQFERGLREVEARTRVTREDYERHAKGFEAVVGSLFRAIGPLITALIGIGSAIEAIDWTKHAAAATTQFGNLADVIGIGAEQLAAWKQAADAAAGSGEELAQAFAHQQQALQKMGPGGTGEVDVGLLGALQHYGIDQKRYYDERTKLYDIDRLNRDIAAASARMGESAAQRSAWLSRLGITSPGNQSLYQSREFLEEALRKQREVGVVSKQNIDAMKKLQEDFSNLASAATNLGYQIVTNLADPLHTALTALQSVLTWLKNFEVPAWMKSVGVPPPTGMAPPTTGPFGSRPGTPPTPAAPPGQYSPGPHTGVMPWDPFGLQRQPVAPSAVPAPPTGGMPSPQGAPSTPLIEETPGGAGMVGPRTGVRPPLPMVPGPQGALDLPQLVSVMSLDNQVKGGVTRNSSANIVIGAMSFQSTTSDSKLDHAPASSERTLAVGSYAVHANTSLI